jgi:mono/diheme cytochrome c family protein
MQPSQFNGFRSAAVMFRLAARFAAMLAMACVLAPAQNAQRNTDQPAADRADAKPGLWARCKDSRHEIEMAVPSPSFLLDPSESVHPALEPSFECEWQGSIEILQGGLYQFDRAGMRLWLGDQEIDDQPRQMAAGNQRIVLRYRREPGVAKVRPQWKSERFSWEPLPGSRLTHTPPQQPSSVLVARGRSLVEEYGCTNCHGAGTMRIEQRRGPSLARIGSRLKSGWLRAWLEDPRALRGDARMPQMLSAEQRRDVAAYLATLRGGAARADAAALSNAAAAVSNAAAAAASGANAATPSKQDVDHGAMLMASVGCRACHGARGVSLDGVGSKFEAGALVEYLRRPAEFEPSGRMPSMLLDETEARQLAAYLVQSKNPAVERSGAPGDAGRGKQVFETSRCLACHSDNNAPAGAGRAAKDWKDLRPGRGCLSESDLSETNTETPRYALSADERTAIEAFLAVSQRYPDVSPAPVFAFRQTLERLRCGACHTMLDSQPAAGLAEAPPPLIDTGAKLRKAWLEGVLTGHNRALHWMDLRMPQYEREQVRDLIEGFAKAAGVAPDPALRRFGDFGAQPPVEALQQRGHGLLGTNPAKGGMACIGCHDWGEHKALGEHGPQLISAAQRLREDWFRRWMLDPARILSGTSMPNYFSSAPPEQAAETIAALWAALEKGPEQPPPEGFVVDVSADPEAKPLPTDRPIVVRWDMPEATPAAIAVGLPGGVSYCFDAGESRLRYAWHGGFVDLSPTLLTKRDPETKLSYTAALIGEIFYRSESFPIRVGRLEDIPQRRFRGYRLIDGYPEFHYEVDGSDVYEKIVALDDGRGLVREFRFAVVDRPVWLLAGEGEGVEISSSIGAANAGPIAVPAGRDVVVRLTVVRKN